VTHPLLEPLTADQQSLIQVIGRPIVSGRPIDSLGWPVWDFVKRKFERNTGVDVGPVLASLPTIPREAGTLDGPYGLWWRTGHANASIASGERVGLTIAGLHHLGVGLGGPRSPLPDPVTAILGILAGAARDEVALDSEDWWLVTRGSIDLRSVMGGREDSPVEIVGATLQHEYEPLAQGVNQFNYELTIGDGRLARFLEVTDVADYLSRLRPSSNAELVGLPDSPLPLPGVLDYLGRILRDQPGWGAERHLVRLRDFTSAAVVTQPPSTGAEFEQRLSALWSIVGHFDVPAVLPARYPKDWGDSQTSINRLLIWLQDQTPEFAGTDQCKTAIATIRNIGRLRQGAQHSSASTRATALKAQYEMDLPAIITDYSAAWATVLSKVAAAFYTLCLGVALRPDSAS